MALDLYGITQLLGADRPPNFGLQKFQIHPSSPYYSIVKCLHLCNNSREEAVKGNKATKHK